MLTRLFVLFSCLCSVSASASASEWQSLHSLLPEEAQLSYIVVDANSQGVLTKHQSKTLRTPASVQKLLTATAAKLHLGENFQYETMLTGSNGKVTNSYKGDLRLNFVGDPTFKRNDIRAMLTTLKRLGLKKIEGDFILNDSHFNGYQWSDGQAWNDLGVCYTSPSNAIIVNRNCVLGNLSKNKKDAKKAKLYVPVYEPISITADVDIVTKEQREMQFCALELMRNSQNNYHLWGCIVPRKRPFAMAFAINDPFQYASKIIADELQQLGITLKGKVRLENEEYQGNRTELLVSYHSPKLDELLTIMMKESDNLIADSLFKTIGASYFQRAGNFRNGSKAVKAILSEQGIDLGGAYLADGSGLSRHNLMSTELFMSVLRFVYKHDEQLGLLSSFSVAGIDGTLKYHKGVRGKQFKGKVIAKTGSLKGVANLLGVVKSPLGERLFVLMINGYYKPKKIPLKQSTSAEEPPIYRFEQAFFETILNHPAY